MRTLLVMKLQINQSNWDLNQLSESQWELHRTSLPTGNIGIPYVDSNRQRHSYRVPQPRKQRKELLKLNRNQL
jgi:hypothetical protein